MLRKLLPRRTEFFDLFCRQAALPIDAVCPAIMENLHRSFVTPIDRGESTSQAIVLHDVRSGTPESEGMARRLVEATQAVKAAVDSRSDRMDAGRTRRLLAWKDIHADVESAVDSCEDVANLVGGVVLENA